MDVVCREEVFKGIGRFTGARTHAGIVPAVARGIVEIECQARLPRAFIHGITDPVSGRPGIDGQTLLLTCTGPGLAHLTELPGYFIREVEPALSHFDPVADHMSGLIRVFGGTQTLSDIVGRTIVILVIDIEGLDHHPRDHLQLVIENKHIGIAVRIPSRCVDRATRSRSATGDVGATAADRGCLCNIRFRVSEPAEVAVERFFV